VAEARLSPEKGRSDDGISELFAEVLITDSTPISPAPVAPVQAAPVQYATRREMREALAAQAAGKIVAAPAVTVPDAATDPIAAFIAPSAAVPAAPVASPLIATPVVSAAAPVPVATPTAPAPLLPPAPVAYAPITTASIPVIPAPRSAAGIAVEPAAVWAQLAESASERSADTAAAGPSRRELRGARSAAAVASVAHTPTDGVDPVELRGVPMAKATKPAPRTPHHVPKKRASALVTMVAVCGLFATAALPAYALSTVDDDAAKTNAKVLASDVTTLTVPAGTSIATKRGDYTATSTNDIADQMSNAQKAANYKAYMASGAREQGDDYPYFSELSNNQGGGLSPLNYYYRECVDFVAWRLNRDAGSTEAPFKWDWSYLTPGGGNAYQWKSNWAAHGWTISNTPKVGSVAWFGYHVAYVSSVNDDGTVTIEEYNHNSDHIYGKRTIPATDVSSYLYAPPR